MDGRRREQQKSAENISERVQRFGPGEAALELKPADFILTHGSSMMGRLIRVGERLRYRGPDRKYARWNHVALLVDADGGHIEADERGVHRADITKYEAVGVLSGAHPGVRRGANARRPVRRVAPAGAAWPADIREHRAHVADGQQARLRA